MKPIRIFFLLLLIFLIFFILSILFPGQDVPVTRTFSVNFPSIREVMMPKKPAYADIASILEQKRSDVDSAVRITKKDTLIKSDSSLVKMVAQALEYPAGDKTVLYPFFDQLEAVLEGGDGIHILHYGDSQLEGDRITDYLRLRFQTEFGGSGPGLLPFGEEAYRIAMPSSSSDNWIKHNLMGTKYKDQGSHPYGPMGCFFTWSDPSGDTVSGQKKGAAWINFRAKGIPPSKSEQYSRCRIFFENFQSPAKVSFYNGESKIKTDTLSISKSFQTCSIAFPETPSNLTVRFSGAASPDLYGICLDSQGGVSVDNIPIRGSSGLEFTRMNPALVTAMYKALNVKLVILQFGVNVVPGNLDDYTYYENGLLTQINQLKSLNPGMCFIVIGLSDASWKKGDAYETIPCVEKILNAQRNAAMRSGCAFWNLYQAMGGKNSMPSWVLAKEPLASSDFLHFNYAGARIVGKMFYSALISDYNEYVAKKSK